MKHAIPRSLPQIIITIVIVIVGASIVLNQLGVSFSGKPASVKPVSSPQGGAAQGQAPGQAPGQAGANGTSGQPATTGTATQPARTGSAGKRVVAVRAVAITTGSIRNYTKIHGDVVSRNEVKIYPNVGGKLLERKAAVGDWVSKGTEIALVDPSKVGQTFMPNPIESTVSGTILSIPVSEGDTISANTVIATVGDLSRTQISTAVPERYLSNLRVGTAAEVSFDAIPGQIFAAMVSEMNPVVDTASRTLDVTLLLEKADPRILVGMFATIKLVTDSRNKVLVLPRISVTLGSNDSYVFVIKADNTVERRIVILGLEGEDSFEVKQGLRQGERVVTEGKGSITEGDAVRIIDGQAAQKDGAAR